MAKTMIFSQVLLMYMKKRRKTWKTSFRKASFTFLTVFKAISALHLRMLCALETGL